MGTPDFAVPALTALIAAGHDIAAVYSQPPRPAGRGQKDRLSPVHALAAERGLTVETPKTLRNAEAQARFASFNADIAVVAAYGLILPKSVLDAPKFGCLNIHGSLLPRWALSVVHLPRAKRPWRWRSPRRGAPMLSR